MTSTDPTTLDLELARRARPAGGLRRGRARRRRGPARRGRHQRRDARPARDRVGRPRRARRRRGGRAGRGRAGVPHGRRSRRRGAPVGRRRGPGHPRRRAALGARPGAGAADRRADRAELPVPPVRRRDRHVPLGRRAGRHRGAGARHPQDTPGFRALEKYAVRCGGGLNHRATLSDQALVKDNHVLAAGGVVPAYRAVRERYPDLPVQVEVTTLDQLRELLDVGAPEILLDNMSHRADGRGGPRHRRPGPARGLRRAHPRTGPRGRLDRRRPDRGRCDHALRAGARRRDGPRPPGTAP